MGVVIKATGGPMTVLKRHKLLGGPNKILFWHWTVVLPGKNSNTPTLNCVDQFYTV